MSPPQCAPLFFPSFGHVYHLNARNKKLHPTFLDIDEEDRGLKFQVFIIKGFKSLLFTNIRDLKVNPLNIIFI
jgi:hypothetical protein